MEAQAALKKIKIWEGTEARMDLIFKIRGYVYTFFKDLKYRIALYYEKGTSTPTLMTIFLKIQNKKS
jgi:hypothetical protein